MAQGQSGPLAVLGLASILVGLAAGLVDLTAGGKDFDQALELGVRIVGCFLLAVTPLVLAFQFVLTNEDRQKLRTRFSALSRAIASRTRDLPTWGRIAICGAACIWALTLTTALFAAALLTDKQLGGDWLDDALSAMGVITLLSVLAGWLWLLGRRSTERQRIQEHHNSRSGG